MKRIGRVIRYRRLVRVTGLDGEVAGFVGVRAMELYMGAGFNTRTAASQYGTRFP